MKEFFFVLLSFLIAPSQHLNASPPLFFEEVLTGEFLLPYDKATPPKSEAPPVEIEQQARWAFSGMIYGFHFSFTPAKRASDDRLILHPLGRLPPEGVGRFIVLPLPETERRERRFMGRYFLEEERRERRALWRSSRFQVFRGEGRVALAEKDLYREAVTRAMAAGLRSYLRRIVYNRPRKVTGEVALSRVPLVGIQQQEYVAKVTFQFRIEEMDYSPLGGN